VLFKQVGYASLPLLSTRLVIRLRGAAAIAVGSGTSSCPEEKGARSWREPEKSEKKADPAGSPSTNLG